MSDHLQELGYNISTGTKKFVVSQREGSRTIDRNIKHYPLFTTYYIANAARKINRMNSVIDLCKQYGIEFNKLFVSVRKEYQFQDLLVELLSGIVTIKPQYVLQGYIIDFYIPEFNLGIEYDEDSHNSEKHKLADINRQEELEQSTGICFIRITQDKELQGLNTIIKLVLQRLSQKLR